MNLLIDFVQTAVSMGIGFWFGFSVHKTLRRSLQMKVDALQAFQDINLRRLSRAIPDH